MTGYGQSPQAVGLTPSHGTAEKDEREGEKQVHCQELSGFTRLAAEHAPNVIRGDRAEANDVRKNDCVARW